MYNPNQSQSGVAALVGQVRVARTDTIAFFIFTLINIVLLFFGDLYFLFSAAVPYFVAVIPFAVSAEAAAEASLLLYVICIGLAVILALPYLFAFLFSKKHPMPWLIVALVCVSIDTVAMVLLNGADIASSVFDILFHIWMIVTLVRGLSGASKLRKLQAQMAAGSDNATFYTAPGDAGSENATYYQAPGDAPAGDGSRAAENTPALRSAGTEEKIKVYLETDAYGRHIVYRKYGKIEELVVDGYVYSECGPKGLMMGHEMSVQLDGHVFTAGMFNHNYINIDGVTVKSSVRWF